MGSKPSKPAVTYAKAVSKLEVDEEKLKSFFLSMASPIEGSSSALRVTIESMKMQFQFAKPFFDLGTKVSERLFAVLGADSYGLDFECFVISLYLFTRATVEEKQRLVFDMFDKNGSGTISKNEFRDMILILLQKDNENVIDEIDSPFKALSKLLSDSAMALYDSNKDNKLSFDEWLVYTESDEDIQKCLSSMVYADIDFAFLD